MSELREKLGKQLMAFHKARLGYYYDTKFCPAIEDTLNQIITAFLEELGKVGEPVNPYTPIGHRSFAINVLSRKSAFNEGAEAQHRLTLEHFKEE